MSGVSEEERIRRQQELAIAGNSFDDPGQEVKIIAVPPPPTTKYGRIYRSAAFQIVIVAMLAFSGPGMSEAITALGGGGQAAPWAVNAATAVSYVMVACVSAVGGPIASRLTIRWMLIIGAATFPINGSAYYVVSKYLVNWYLILGRAIYGVGFGLWYVAEAAMILSYPEEGRRGKQVNLERRNEFKADERYLGMWVGSRNGGQLLAGCIALARNVQNASAGAVTTSTYLIFIAIECLGFPVSWLISPPEKVRRSDGVPIILAAKHPWKIEFKILGRAMLQRRMLLVIPAAVNSFFYGGVAYTYLAKYFSVRARALSGVLQPAGAIISTLLYGRYILDNGRWNQKRRAQIGFLAWVAPMVACIAWMIGNQTLYNKMTPTPKYDWTADGWANAYMPFLIIQMVGYWGQSYVYWLLSCFATDIQSNARNGGIFRFWEAVGQAISYGINSNKALGSGPMYGNLAICVFQVPFTWMIVRGVPTYRADDKHRPAEIDRKDVEQGDDDFAPKNATSVTVHEMQTK